MNRVEYETVKRRSQEKYYSRVRELNAQIREAVLVHEEEVQKAWDEYLKSKEGKR